MDTPDQMLDYYCVEMEQEIPTGEARRYMMMMVKSVLERHPEITTKEEFLFEMNNFED